MKQPSRQLKQFPSNRPIVIAVSGLTKRIKNKAVLSNITFSIRRSEIVGILGKNGAGKTMLLYTLIGLVKPESGSIKIFGKTLESNLSEIRQRMNIASSHHHLQLNSTIRDNLKSFASFYQVSYPQKTISNLLDLFKIEYLSNQNEKLIHLSSGELTKVNLCKAFINDPEVVLLDEPFATLDPLAKKQTLSTILKIHSRSNATILFSSHILSEVTQLCGRIIILESGTVVYDGQILPERELESRYEKQKKRLET